MYQLDELVIGTIKDIKPFAFFMSFPDGSEGLLHISEISDSYIRDIEKYGSIGDEIKVKVISIDEKNGFLRVSLKKVPQDQAYSSHKNTYRKPPEIKDDSFEILKEHLPQWMEETLNKIKK